MRAAEDLHHTKFLLDMRKPSSNWTNDAIFHLRNLKYLQREDFFQGFETAPIIVTNNNELALMIYYHWHTQYGTENRDFPGNQA